MKKFAFLLPAMFLFGCLQQTTSTETKELSEKITYFKDERTGLCFASINSYSYSQYQIVSITCVPCDSLKRFKGF